MYGERLFLGLALAAAAAWGHEYAIDGSHSSAGFSVRHLMVSNVKGDFKKISGKIEYDEKTPESLRIEAVIDAASIDTRDAKRDEHLRSPDFFDVAKYPTIEFRSKRIEKSGGKLAVRGDLTIHGVTREVVLDLDGPTPEIKDPRGNFRRGATATTKINRKDFGLTWSRTLETGGVVVGDEVSITIEVEAMRQGK